MIRHRGIPRAPGLLAIHNQEKVANQTVTRPAVKSRLTASTGRANCPGDGEKQSGVRLEKGPGSESSKRASLEDFLDDGLRHFVVTDGSIPLIADILDADRAGVESIHGHFA